MDRRLLIGIITVVIILMAIIILSNHNSMNYKCNINNLLTGTIPYNNTLIVWINASCETKAIVYMNGNKLGNVKIKPGDNILIFEKPFELIEGKQVTIIVKVDGESYKNLVKVEPIKELIEIIPKDSYINVNNNTLYLTIKNVGNWIIKIDKISLIDEIINSDYIIKPKGGYPIVLMPGQQITVVAKIRSIQPIEGVSYTISIYTKSGKIFSFSIFGK